MNRIIAALFLLSLCAPAVAGDPVMKLKPKAPGCMTPELLDQFIQAIKDNDEKTGEGLLNAGCVILPPDIVQAELLSVRTDKLEIRVTKGTASLTMWIPIQYEDD